MSKPQKTVENCVQEVLRNVCETPQFKLTEHIPVTAEVPNVLKIGLFNEIHKEIEINKQYMRTPISLEQLIHAIYNNRKIHVRIALLLWNQVQDIRKYKNNEHETMQLLIDYIENSISCYVYDDLIPVNVHKSYKRKIRKTIKDIITNSIKQIRKAGEAENTKKHYKKTCLYYHNNVNADSNNPFLSKLVKLWFKSCKINRQYLDITDNSILLQRVTIILRRYLHAKILKEKDIILSEMDFANVNENDNLQGTTHINPNIIQRTSAQHFK